MTGATTLDLAEPELSFSTEAGCSVQRTILPSGVRVLTEYVPGAASVTLGCWVPVGSRDEGETEGADHLATFGSTHFLEHLLFKGTPSRSPLDIAVAFDSVGGEHNAVTSKEYTCYYAKVQDRDLLMAVDVLSDMVTSSLISHDEFDNERTVILEELSMADDDPVDHAHERLYESVFGAHPLGRPVGGTPQTIRDASRDGVVAHYRHHYRPSQLVVTAAGAVDHGTLVERVSQRLEAGGWDLTKTAEPAARRSSTPSALRRADDLVCVTRPLEQVSLVWGMPGLTAGDDDRFTQAVLNSVLGGGMSSRLFQEVRERRGLAYSVYSFAQGYADAGLFGLFAGCAPDKAAEVARLVRGELERLATDPISEEERSRAVGQLRGASALALEDSDARMARLGRSEIAVGRFVDLNEQQRRLEAVTADDVRALAARLAAEPASLVAVGSIEADQLAGVVR